MASHPPVSRIPPSPRSAPTLPSPARGGGLGRGREEGQGEGQLADRVLYRDGLILVIDKPAGIAVHPGPGGGPNLESRFDELRFGLPHPPALAHRLDRDTSGCLVLGRHPKALRRLGALFANGRVEKVYWAVVEGQPPETEGRMESDLRKLSRGSGWRMIVDPAGQRAITDYRVCGTAPGRAWLELRPRTGRTHQLRVHCAELGCPVVGDPVYGDGGGGKPLMLYARSIRLPLYPARPPLEIVAPVPPHMLTALQRLGCEEVQTA
jgi:RluA family pseudouridine synthase